VNTGLAGKSAIVTGGARGIGLACARALSEEGARVVIGDLDGDVASAAAGQLGRDCVSVPADVTSAEDCRRLVAEATARWQRLDVLVTCAGIFHATPFDEITADEWDRIQAVNLKGTFLTCQAALRAMIPQGEGRIVTIASLGGQTGGLAAGAAYAASKAGVVALTKSIARYAGQHGVIVNTVNPGVIDTAMTAAWPAEVRQRVVAQTPLARIGEPVEVAAMVCVLASDVASFVHGTHVDVNGGLLMD
jgi:NAD(P)-dependent dehydrogenase (short-subunit alcohol dehydrogenase family)